MFWCCFLFEAFLSYYGSTTFKDIKVYKNKNGKNYDLRDKEKFYHDLTKKDDQIVVTVYPSTIIEIEKNILPLSGISNSKTIYCNENGYYSVYLSDRYGFNNPDIEWDSKK